MYNEFGVLTLRYRSPQEPSFKPVDLHPSLRGPKCADGNTECTTKVPLSVRARLLLHATSAFWLLMPGLEFLPVHEP